MIRLRLLLPVLGLVALLSACDTPAPDPEVQEDFMENSSNNDDGMTGALRR